MATIYFDDEEQLDDDMSFLFGLMKTTPNSRQLSGDVAFVYNEVKYVSVLSLLNIVNDFTSHISHLQS